MYRYTETYTVVVVDTSIDFSVDSSQLVKTDQKRQARKKGKVNSASQEWSPFKIRRVERV